MTEVLIFLSLIVNLTGDGGTSLYLQKTWLLTDHTQSQYTFGDFRGDVLKFMESDKLELHDLKSGAIKSVSYHLIENTVVAKASGQEVMEIKSLTADELILRRVVYNGEVEEEREMIYHPIPSTINKAARASFKEQLASDTWELSLQNPTKSSSFQMEISKYEGQGTYDLQMKIQTKRETVVAPIQISEIEGCIMLRSYIPTDSILGLETGQMEIENYIIREISEDEMKVEMEFNQSSTFRRK